MLYGTEDDPREENGRCAAAPIRGESTPFSFDKRTEAALVELGQGKLSADIDVIAEHPSLTRKRDDDREEYQYDRIHKADRIEKKFIAAYKEAE